MKDFFKICLAFTGLLALIVIGSVIKMLTYAGANYLVWKLIFR